MQETTRLTEMDNLLEKAPSKVARVTELEVPQQLQEYKVQSLTEVGLDDGQSGKICQLDNKHGYSTKSIAEVRNAVDESRVAVMLDTNFKDKSATHWVKVYKTVAGVKTLVARFDPQNRVLHIDHHLTLDEIGDTPLNQEGDSDLPASTTPLAVSLLRGLREATLFTDDPSDRTIETLNTAWDSQQFMTFVDHFDPDSTESALTILKATKENIFHEYFDNQVAMTLDADHVGTYRNEDGTPNVRERLVKAISGMNDFSISRTLRAIKVLEDTEDLSQLSERLEAHGLQTAAELYTDFEKKLENTETVAQNMASHYDGQGNVLYNVLPSDADVDMAYLSDLLKKMYSEKIGPGGFEFVLVVKDNGEVEDQKNSGLHEYGAWLRTLHESVDLNTFGSLLELLGIFGRSSARGNRNATTLMTKRGITFTLAGKTDLSAEFSAGSKWRSENPWGLVKLVEMIFSRDNFISQIEQYIGSRPDSIPTSKKIPGTQQERGVAIDTISSGERSGQQRVIKYLIFPLNESPNAEFLSEIRTAGIVADLLWKDGEQLVLIPEAHSLIIKPGFIGAEMEKVEMIANPKKNEMGMPIIENKMHAFAPISENSHAILAHLDDMRRVPQHILDAGGVPTTTAEQYRAEVQAVLAELPSNTLTDAQVSRINHLEFNFDTTERVLVNGRTKPSNMFRKGERIGQTDWESISQGHHFEDQVALASSFLLINPDEVHTYLQGMDVRNPNVAFLFVRKALFAIDYNLKKSQRLRDTNDTQELEITEQKIRIHREIINWALSEDKNLDIVTQLSLEMRKKIYEYRPESAHQDSQLFGYSLEA